MTISVIIPTYNSSKFIEETIASILSQSLLPGEIIISDDCSTDNTFEIVDSIARTTDVPIRFLRAKSNSGDPATPINAAIRAASYDRIALLDHDDLMCPDKLATQFKALEDTKLRLVFSDYIWFDDSESKVGLEEFDYKLFSLYASVFGDALVLDSDWLTVHHIIRPGTIQSCSNLMFDKSLWEQYGPFDENYRTFSDYKFTLAVTAKEKIAFVPRVLFHKRRHQSNLFASEGAERRWLNVGIIGLEYLPNPRWLRKKSPMSHAFGAWLLDQGWNYRAYGWRWTSFKCYLAYIHRFRFNKTVFRHLIGLASSALRSLYPSPISRR